MIRKTVFHTLTLFTITITLMGCVASHTATAPDIRNVKYPAIGQEVTAGLGERLLESGRAIKVNGFRLQSDVDIFDATVKAGLYHQIGIKEKHKVFGPAHGVGTGIVGALSIT